MSTAHVAPTQKPESFSHLDFKGFARELKEIRTKLDAERGSADFAHLRRRERIGRAASLVGLLTAAIAINPISIFLLSFGTLTRWMVTHHVSHRGYNRVENIPFRYTSHGFAKGWRRFVDWFDWIDPTAWDQEHNVFHHYYTSEREDPDLVESNMDWVRDWRGPRFLKTLFLGLLACTWKFTYYAPNTLRIWQRVRARKNSATAERGKLRNIMHFDGENEAGFGAMYSPFNKEGRELWWRCLLPYGIGRFVILPALFLPLGQSAAIAVLVSLVLAEVLTNIHAFVVIGPNHAGGDLYRFEEPIRERDEYYVRQVISAVNFKTGGAVNDFMHAYLNYQIEHHIWPDMTMLQYEKAQPLVKELCAKYDVPYVQESVWLRVHKLWSIVVGKSTMRVAVTTPEVLSPSAEEELEDGSTIGVYA
jgi:fatty acid desaturase